MRTDRIDDAALEQARKLYEFSEKGGPNYHNTGIRAEDVPVLAPQVSKLKKEDAPWQPDSAFYGNKPVGSGPPSFNYGEEQGTGEFNSLHKTLHMIMDQLEQLGGDLRRARQMGNFRLEHIIVDQRNELEKQKSAIEAQMMVKDLGRYQREMNNEMMYKSQNQQDMARNPALQFSEYVAAIDENDEKISRLEAMLLEYAENKNLKSAGGDSNADPGQSYSPEDDEEDDEEEDDDDDAIGYSEYSYAEIEIEIDTDDEDEEEEDEEDEEEA